MATEALITKIEKELENRIKENNFQPITINMKYDKTNIVIKPCSYKETITSIDDCDFFLVDSPVLPWLSDNTLHDVAKNIANYKESVEQQTRQKARLEEIKEELLHPTEGMTEEEWEDRYSFFSDFSKDVYGHRIRLSKPTGLK